MTVQKRENRAFTISDKIANKEPIDDAEINFLIRETESKGYPNIARVVVMCLRELGNPLYAQHITPLLYEGNIELASVSIKALCKLGQGENNKAYMFRAVDVGLDWDPEREVGHGALWAAGMHLKNHRDRDLAQLLIRWAPRDYNDPFYRNPPPGLPDWRVRSLSNAAGYGMGLALGADPEDLVYDDDLIIDCSKRFIAERQDG